MDITIIVAIIIIVVYIAIENKCLFRRLKRKKFLKKMEFDENINILTEDMRYEINCDEELKILKRKAAICNIGKIFIGISGFVTLFGYTIWMAINIFLHFEKNKTTNIVNLDLMKLNMSLIGFVYIVLFIIIFLINAKVYKKFKDKFKEIIIYDLLPRMDNNIYWNIKKYDEINIDDESYEILSKMDGKNNIKDLFVNSFIKYEDYLKGEFQDEFIIEVVEYKNIIRGYKRKKILKDEGLFCQVALDKSINNSIIISNNRNFRNLIYKRFTNMTEEFNRKFKMFIKNEYKVNKKISKETIDELIKFENESKLKFDISIINNKISFKFKTIDFWEPKLYGQVLDELMLKEFLNILLFVTNFSKSIKEDLAE